MKGKRQLRPYLHRLPFGERLPLGDVLGSELFPFEGEIVTRPLEQPRLPEPKRRGEPGGEACPDCGRLEESAIWGNERWVVRTPLGGAHGLPAVVMLEPRAHHDLEDLPEGLAGELGIMIRRVARAIAALPDVGRVHVNRWGDGSEHFHVWFAARPLGMWQMRGAMLAVWDDLLPRMPPDEWTTNLRAVAAALAAEDGRALI